MATINQFEKRAQEALMKKGHKALTIDALLWFERELKKSIQSATVSGVKKFGTESKKFYPGQLVLYKYDPKTKDQLPFYDTVPLVLITNVTSKGWWGISLHYLPQRIRTWLLNALYEANNRQGILEKDRLKFNWQIAQAVAQTIGSVKHLENAIKQYLPSHVKSMPLVIDAEHWDMIVHMPLARFKKGKPY